MSPSAASLTARCRETSSPSDARRDVAAAALGQGTPWSMQHALVQALRSKAGRVVCGHLLKRLTCVHLQRLWVHEHQRPVHRARSVQVRLAVPCDGTTALEW